MDLNFELDEIDQHVSELSIEDYANQTSDETPFASTFREGHATENKVSHKNQP